MNDFSRSLEVSAYRLENAFASPSLADAVGKDCICVKLTLNSNNVVKIECKLGVLLRPLFFSMFPTSKLKSASCLSKKRDESAAQV